MCERVLEEGELSPLTTASEVECGMVGSVLLCVVMCCGISLRWGVLLVIVVAVAVTCCGVRIGKC